jgi:hypothetical protein
MIDRLVERSAPLKQQLLEYSRRPRFDREFRREFYARFPGGFVPDEAELPNFLDWFILEYRRADGRTLVEEFVESAGNLPADEREFLLGWRDVVDGLFEVVGRDGPALVAANLVDDLEYRIRANVGPEIFDRWPVGGFLSTRVVPVGPEWLISGASAYFGADQRENVLIDAARLVAARPDLVFRNPRLLERGWELHRAERERFVEHFGADTVVLDIAEAPERLREYEAAGGMSAPTAAVVVDRLHPEARTIGLIFDESLGLGAFADFGRLEEAFTDPELIRSPAYRRLVKTYLTDEDLSPVPLRRLADRDHEKADRVLRLATGKPRFRWAVDGEEMLRRHKPHWYARPPLPGVTVVGDRLAPHLARRV